jgi:mannan endo-1,4-beta-mannosidase
MKKVKIFKQSALWLCFLCCLPAVIGVSCGSAPVFDYPLAPAGIEDPDDPDDPDNPEPGDPTAVVISIVDKNATDETKALYSNLYKIGETGFMFGHHDDLMYGRYWQYESGGSDTRAVCGDYPAVFSTDFGSIMDDRAGLPANVEANAYRKKLILEARDRGEVITAVLHLNNPLTGKDSWDNSRTDVVSEILKEDSPTQLKFKEWLDNLANFLSDLKDRNGKTVPLLFRPFHEHTQSWSWWGASCTTEAEFTGLWRFMVEYLRDTRDVHNLIYVISPQMDGIYSDASSRLLFRWPGDSYVDVLAMDAYHGTNSTAFRNNIQQIVSIASAKRKPCGVSETGTEGFMDENFWTKGLINPIGDYHLGFVVMWRNEFINGNENNRHFYSVYPGHPSAPDFIQMYSHKRSLFSKDLPDMYVMHSYVEVN